MEYRSFPTPGRTAVVRVQQAPSREAGASAPPTAGLRPDTAGRAGMITVLTALRPLGASWLRVLFALTRRLPGLTGLGPLESVHFIRWSVLGSLPHDGPPQVRERLPHRLLLWETVYSAPTQPYVETFVYGVGDKVRNIWWTSHGFPGSRSVTGLAGYIGDLSIPGAHWWSAHPGATVRTILSALDVVREHRYLVRAARTTTPAEFAVVYRGFLARRQGDL
ncbi:hypothetical protein [Geodermatophilus amargosae]|uniref:hypothetical protein n=1 Tax=Geodermatophilus amargosae TaxID=1296565 RepID=UPI0034DE1701